MRGSGVIKRLQVGCIQLGCLWSLVVLAGALWTPQAEAAGCLNIQLRSESADDARLPDCRAYEQVTPVDKNGANPIGELNFVQAAPNGQRLTYLVPAGMPGATGEANFPSFLSSRGPGGWASEGLLPATASGATAVLLGWTEDLLLRPSKRPTGLVGFGV